MIRATILLTASYSLTILLGCAASPSSEDREEYRRIFYPLVRHLQTVVCLGMPEEDFLRAVPPQFRLNSSALIKRERIDEQRYRMSTGDVWIDAPFHTGKLGLLIGYDWPDPYRNSMIKLFNFPIDQEEQPLECKRLQNNYHPISFFDSPYIFRFVNSPSAKSKQAFSLSLVVHEGRYKTYYINLPPGFFPNQETVGTIRPGATIEFHQYGNSRLLEVSLEYHEEGLTIDEMISTYMSFTEKQTKSSLNSLGLTLTSWGGATFYLPPGKTLTDYFVIPSEDLFSVERG